MSEQNPDPEPPKPSLREIFEADYDPIISEYLEPGTYDKYDYAEHQRTLPHHRGAEATYTLNALTKAAVAGARARFEAGDWTRRLDKWDAFYSQSGLHVAADSIGLNSFENLRIRTVDSDNPITTSIVVYVDPQWRWVLTHSGSVYALAPREDEEDDADDDEDVGS